MAWMARTWRHAVCLGLIATLTAATSAAAQDNAQVNGGAITVTVASDFTNAYMFRGIRQDDRMVIVQPSLNLGVLVYAGDGWLKTATLDVGTWNSRHPASAPATPAGGGLWYEADVYASMNLGLGQGLAVRGTWTSYTSPNGTFSAVKELAIRVSADGQQRLVASIHPYALFAVEMDAHPGIGQADGGSRAGRYVEIGAAPGFSHGRIGLTLPIKMGLSAGHYYEMNVGTPAEPAYSDSTFGYVSIAGVVTVPFTSRPTAYGTWSVRGGVEWLTLGAATRAFNGGDRSKVMALAGIGFTY